MKELDATDVMDELYTIEEEMTGLLRKGYCRGIDSFGEYSSHMFVISLDDIAQEKFILELGRVITELNPKNVQVSTTKTHPHITLEFNEERIVNAPPVMQSKYDALQISTIEDECTRCARKTPQAYPSLSLRWQTTDSEWKREFETEKVDLCSSCSPGHYDDVARQIQAFCIEESEVVAVDYGETIKYTGEDEFNDPHTETVIKVLERDIL
jgi:hypothetical protein